MTDTLTGAACRDLPGADDIFYPPHGQRATQARRICASCPVRLECLQYALEQESGNERMRHGIWGGLTPWERYEIARGRKKAA